MIRAIVQNDDPVLREVAQPVPPEKILEPEIQELISDMQETLAQEEHGVALAAPQVGESLRLFVVGASVFEEAAGEHLVYINPEITNHSREQSPKDEGCLSVRGNYGNVPRYEKVTVRALDESGTPFIRGTSGLLAQIMQHEIDHLDGILFTDKTV